MVLFLTDYIKSGILSSCSIALSILITASFAPPWAGPHRLATPADNTAQGLAKEDPAILTVEVEAFYSWSAWTINITSRALIMAGSTLNSDSIGLANIIYKKFFM